MTHDRPSRQLSARALAACILMAAGKAAATCMLSVGTAHIDWGGRNVSSLVDSERPGWRLIGSAASELSAVCSHAQTRLRIAVSGLRPLADGVLRAHTADAPLAARLMLNSARAGDTPLRFRLADQDTPPGHAPILLQQDGVIEFDLASLPAEAERKLFSLSLQITGLAAQGWRPGAAAAFRFAPDFQLLP